MTIKFNNLILNKESNCYTVIDYIGNEEILKIPTSYNGLPITKIDSLSTSDNNIIKNIYLPNDIVISETSFTNLNNLEEIIVSDNNKLYSSHQGVLYSKVFKDLLYYPNGKRNEKYQIHSKTKTIGLSFYNNPYLKTLILNKNLRDIYFDSFLYLNNLKKIKINNHYFKSYRGVLYDKEKQVLYKYPANRKNKTYKIKREVSYISPAAFINTNNLRTLVVLSSVEISNKVSSKIMIKRKR